MDGKEEIWSQEFVVRQYHLDFQGRIAPTYLCRMLQEAATHHAESLNLSSERLRKDGLTWVLSKFHLKMEGNPKWPKWNEKIRVETWRSGIERIFVLRDYRVLNSDGEVLGIATSFWAILDIKERRPVMIPASVLEQIPAEQHRIFESKMGKIVQKSREDHKKTFQVGQRDLDDNQHTNNVSYISWALEAVPQNVWSQRRLTELEIIYRIETFFGDPIVSLTQEDSDPEQAVFLHRIIGQADREVAQGRTRWI